MMAAPPLAYHCGKAMAQYPRLPTRGGMAMPQFPDAVGGFRVGLIVIGVLLLLYLSTSVVPAGQVGV